MSNDIINTNAGVRSKAIIYSLKIGMPSDRRSDKKESMILAEQRKAAHNVVTVSKSYFGEEPTYKAIRNVYAETRAFLKANSLPWGDNKQRIVLKSKWASFENGINELEAKWKDALKKFYDDYDNIKYRAQHSGRMSDLYNEEDFPSLDTLKKAFLWESAGASIPDVNDFRVGLSADEEERFRILCENNYKKQIESTIEASLEKVQATVSHLRDKMGSYGVDENGKVVGKFRNATVEAVEEVLDFVKAYNITNNPELDKICEEMKALVSYTPESLREDPALREEVYEAATNILHRVEGYGDVDNGSVQA